MKIHEYNEMMAYLTRPSYVSGGRVGFKRGSGNPIPINASTLAKFNDLIKNTDLTLKEIGRKFGYAADLRSNSYLVKAYEDTFGKIPEARFKPYTMVGTEKAKQILSLYDQQLATLPEANFSAIAREVLGKDDADTRKIVRSLVKRERGFKRTPIPKYEGPLTAEQRRSRVKTETLRKIQDRELVSQIQGVKGSGFDLHHMDSKRWNATMGNLAYVDSTLNQKTLQSGEGQIEKWYKQRDKLADDAIEAHKAINEKGKNFVKQKKFKGLLNFKTYDPATKKFSDFGMDLSKAIIPEGQLEELRNVPLKELTKDQKAKVIEVAQKVRAGLAKGEPGILTKGLKMLGAPLSKLFTAATSPLGAAGFVGTTIKSNIEAGKNVADAIVDPMVGAELLYPELTKKSLAKFSPTLGKILGLGKLGAKFTPAGQYLTLVGLSKEASKAIIEEANRVDQIQDVDEQMAEQERLVRGIKGYNKGGRVGFAKGPKDPGRRLFLKGVGAASLLPFVGKYFKLAAPATKAAAQYTGPVLEGLGNKLKWVQLLAKRLWNEGDDITETASTAEREIVRAGKLESGDDVVMYYNKDTNNVRFSVTGRETGEAVSDTTSGAYNKQYELEYKAPEVIEETGKKTKPEVQVVEEYPRQVTPEDVELDVIDSPVDSALSDLTELEAFAKKKTTKQIHTKKGTKPKDVAPEWDPPDYDWDDFIE